MSSLRHCIRLILENESAEPIRVPLDIPIPNDLKDIHARMKRAGRELFLVGGAVRDTLMGKNPKDYDVATNASPEEVIKILQRNPQLRLDLTGKQFGVVRVKTPEDGEYEIATFREDIGKGKGTSVKFSTIENDVMRRDLTINALFYDMDSGEAVDYVGGIKDIEDGIIRAVGKPAERFDEDRIRILRAIRFAGRMGSDLDPETKQAILEDNELIDTDTGAPIPADRITEEFVKGITSSSDTGHFLSLIGDLGMFDQILPGLDIALDSVGTQDHVAQVAALVRNNQPDQVASVLKRMRYSNNEIKTIGFLLQFISVNRDTAHDLKRAFNRQNISEESLRNFASIVEQITSSKVQGFLDFASAPPAGNPQELMAQGLKGPEIGMAMAAAEGDAYAALVGEVRKYIRSILSESPDSNTKKRTIAIGLCYPHAVKMALNAPVADRNDLSKFKVVHGRVTNKWNDESNKHAWVEKGDMIFDWQSHATKPNGIPRNVYYDMFQPEIYEEYTAAEAIMKCVESGHDGPWGAK